MDSFFQLTGIGQNCFRKLDEVDMTSWGCFLCKNRKNPLTKKECSTCFHPRSAHRFVFRGDDSSFLLCNVNTARRLATVTILKLSRSGELSQSTVILTTDGDSLKDCVNDSVSRYLLNEKVSSSVALSEENEIQSVSSPSLNSVTSSTTSLFNQVLHNAASIVYNGRIGQFVHKDTIDENKDDISHNLLYSHQMRREDAEKRRVVREIQEKEQDALTIHSCRSHHGDSSSPVKAEHSVPCALCGYAFPASQLLGSVTFNNIAKWKADHLCPLPAEDRRLALHRIHDIVSVCLYCYQFFDANFSEVYGRNADVRRDHEEETKRSRIAVSQRMALAQQQQQRKNPHNKEDKEDGTSRRLRSHRHTTSLLRPMSATQIQSEIKKLKLKAEMVSLGLRFQRVQFSRMVDQDKFGRFLRNKYCNVSFL